MKLIIDSEKCILAGECYYNHPELFRQGVDGVPIALDAQVSKDQAIHANQAVEVCPAGAIILGEDT
tara:strand:+ start:153 stop:350 length:198 start_codon:yes stop_codon:yes gene_type:complete